MNFSGLRVGVQMETKKALAPGRAFEILSMYSE
jgi:hypothetical protein